MRESPYMTVNEVAELAGLEPRWIRRLCQQGRLKAEKRGRDWDIDRESAEAWLEERRFKRHIDGQ